MVQHFKCDVKTSLVFSLEKEGILLELLFFV